MSVGPRWRAVPPVVLGLALLAFGGVSCSSGSGGGAAPGDGSTTTLVPSSTGAECVDPTGDLDLPVGVSADTPGLGGVDLVEASAAVADDVLDVTLTVADRVDAAPASTYVVAQGDPLGALSFELRFRRTSDGWTTTLITWPDGVEDRAEVPVTPAIDGDTVTASIPLASLPPIALAMQFGAAADVGDATVIDDCSSLTSG